MTRRALVLLACAWMLPASAAAQIRVNPTGVNVNAQGATTVFLTFGGLNGYTPTEAIWCGELTPAIPDVGMRCDPATIFGRLPVRFDQSRASGSNGFTDIMSIPPSVARRAYQAAEQGQTSGFFYVRRFVRPGAPDQYVTVTCRLAGGGARVPLALTDVRLAFDVETPVLYVRPGELPPAIKADIAYNGTGRLKGRWEIVLPGEEMPGSQDLLTEATLPLELRGSQRRYTEIARFNVFLPPAGRYTLAGPDPRRLATAVEGSYLVLLRIEASDDKEADSNLAAAGAGSGIVHAGAVAGFPLPPLRYIVGGASSEAAAAAAPADLEPLAPAERAHLARDEAVEFAWREVSQAAIYRIDVETESAQPVLSALVGRGAGRYTAPSWLKDRTPEVKLRWRVAAISASGNTIRISPWRHFELASQ